MSKSKRPTTPERTALASTHADLRELKGNSSATVQELREFLRELKGRSPQEMLGLVAASSLFRSIVISTALVAGAILLFTAIPYFFGEKETPVPAEEVSTDPEPTPPESTDQPPAETTTPIPAEPADPLSPLGVGEELSAPANENPLENKGDDFLKDLE